MWKGLALFFLLFLAACAPTDAATPDLYLAAKSSQATADAAQYESKYLGEQLTATAEAPIIHITETAAAFQVQSAVSVSSHGSYWLKPPPTQKQIFTSGYQLSVLKALKPFWRFFLMLYYFIFTSLFEFLENPVLLKNRPDLRNLLLQNIVTKPAKFTCQAFVSIWRWLRHNLSMQHAVHGVKCCQKFFPQARREMYLLRPSFGNEI